jgi:hypothetical protein
VLAGLCAGLSPGQNVTKLNNFSHSVQDSGVAGTDGRLGLGSNGKGDDLHVSDGRIPLGVTGGDTAMPTAC